MSKQISRIIQVFVGSFISAVGILLFLYANLGVDPISTLLLGIMNYLPIKFGTASQGFNVVVLVIVFFLDRRKIGLGSIINALSVGFFVNLLSALQVTDHLIAAPYLYAFLGPVILGIGTGYYLAADLGCGALEGLMIVLSEKTRFTMKSIRIFLDFTLVVSGILLGSVFGLGTFLGILCIGPSIEYTMKLYSHFFVNETLVRQ